jgi:hypothetical protein
MQKFLIVDENGTKQQFLAVPSAEYLPAFPPGWSTLAYAGAAESLSDVDAWLVDGAFVAGTLAPSIEAAKLAMWEQTKALRQAKIYGGVNIPGLGLFDSKPEAIQNVAGAALTALVLTVSGTPELFSAEWTLADNSSRTLSAQDMLQVQIGGTQFINAVHARARGLRSAIFAAGTAEALAQIDIAAGWPA